jgi:hypothetical protein
MIEDMQVAVGCDGYADANAAASVMGPVPNSDPGFEEVGPSAGAVLGPNFTIDENASGSQRDSDEWLGNAQAESWAPDCVWHGTAQYNLAAWEGLEGTSSPSTAPSVTPTLPPTDTEETNSERAEATLDIMFVGMVLLFVTWLVLFIGANIDEHKHRYDR